MKVTIGFLLTLLLVGSLAILQWVQEDEKLAVDVPEPVQLALPILEEPAAVEPASAEVQQLMKLREKAGSRLTGSLLEDDPQATNEVFTKALEEVTSSSNNADSNVEPARFHVPKLPQVPQVPQVPQTPDQFAAPQGDLPYLLRYTSAALDRRAGELEIQRDFENAQMLRKQAGNLRKQAILIESLSAESAVQAVEN